MIKTLLKQKKKILNDVQELEQLINDDNYTQAILTALDICNKIKQYR